MRNHYVFRGLEQGGSIMLWGGWGSPQVFGDVVGISYQLLCGWAV